MSWFVKSYQKGKGGHGFALWSHGSAWTEKWAHSAANRGYPVRTQDPR